MPALDNETDPQSYRPNGYFDDRTWRSRRQHALRADGHSLSGMAGSLDTDATFGGGGGRRGDLVPLAFVDELCHRMLDRDPFAHDRLRVVLHHGHRRTC